MPSSLRSKTHSGPVKRLSVRVAAMGTIHSGNDARTSGLCPSCAWRQPAQLFVWKIRISALIPEPG